VLSVLLFLSACGGSTSQSFQATLPATQSNAPIYSPTPTRTPTLTPTFTLTPTLTFTPSFTPTLTPTPTFTLSPTPTQPLFTLTPASNAGAPPQFVNEPAGITLPEGWSCEDFPCEDDIEGFLKRIRVPPGYVLEHVGHFPGQPMQIVYGPDGRLYATVLENGTRSGAVYVMNADGTSTRYSGQFISPIGLAFQPGTDVLYVSARVTLEHGGGLWRVLSDGTMQPVVTDLPCCYSSIDNQPNGIVFGPDGYLYMGIGALTDHSEPANPEKQRYADILPLEAGVLRINPHTGAVSPYAQGLRNPFDVTFDSTGQFYATDSGLVDGPGDRLLRLEPGAHFGWPFYRNRGCDEACPPTDFSVNLQDDLYTFPDYSLPRGLVAYTGTQFPVNLWDNLFVVLWNGTDYAQRVVRIDPRDWRLGSEDYAPEPFVTGLIRPVDVTIAPDGSLVVADFIYGHIWRVRYVGGVTSSLRPVPTVTPTQQTSAATPTSVNFIFVTATPKS
jgi:glucose/arabinose dehydrogenase